MEEDLSNRTITILVILTVTISVLGTLSVMNAVNEIKMQKSADVKQKGPTQGEVSLQILPPKEKNSATGMVGLELLPPKDKEEGKILLLPD